MSSFICTDRHDENLLIELFSLFTSNHRPTISVHKFADRVHDISGTLERIHEANLLSMHKVLVIDNVTVECVLIDEKQIDATILIKNITEARCLWQSGVLRWQNINGKVRRVVEGWTRNGSNVKFDRTIRIYTSHTKATRFFRLDFDGKLLEDEISRMKRSFNEQMNEINDLNKEREQIRQQLDKLKQSSTDEKQKLQKLVQVRFRYTRSFSGRIR